MLWRHQCARTQAAAAAPKVKTLGATDLLGMVSKRLKAAPRTALAGSGRWLEPGCEPLEQAAMRAPKVK